MTRRIDYSTVSPNAVQAMRGLERYLATSQIERPLRELVKVRASLLNGCAYCIDMHTKEARAAGETEQRLYLLSAWREAPFYTERERAALAWTDALTLVADTHVPDEVYAVARDQFSEAELVDLTMVVVTINSWNRIVLSFRSEVGSYQPSGKHHDK
jgi:AhpD family alkylhydroperoxidase